MSNKQQLTTTTKDSRHFTYSKGEVTLDFKLRTDMKTQLKDFGECLKAAQKDVAEELARFK